MNRFFVGAAALALAATAAGAQVTAAVDSAPGSVVTRGHGAFYLQPYAGYLIGGELTGDPQLTLEDKPLYGAQLGYSFSPNVTIVGNVAYSPTNFAYETRSAAGVNQPASNNVDLLVYDANLQFRVPFVANRVGSTVAPFLQAGVGAIKFSPDQGNELNDFKKGTTNVAFNAGVGVDFQIRKLIGIRVMAKDYITSLAYDDISSTSETVTTRTDNKVSNNIALTAGLNFGF
jgi:opacity protein-like surface antigen